MCSRIFTAVLLTEAKEERGGQQGEEGGGGEGRGRGEGKEGPTFYIYTFLERL